MSWTGNCCLSFSLFICFTVYCYNDVSHLWQLVNLQSITQMEWLWWLLLYSFPAFCAFRAFRATHINQMKTFPFAQAEVRIAHCNLCVNLCTHEMCECCTHEQHWWINHLARLLGSEALSQPIKRLRQRDKLGLQTPACPSVSAFDLSAQHCGPNAAFMQLH